jgi:hypothetical protein
VAFDVETGHDSEDSEDSLDDVENDLVDCRKDDEMPEDDFLQVDEDIHLGSLLLRDLISTVPVVGSQNVQVAQDNVPVSKKRVTNWNFLFFTIFHCERFIHAVDKSFSSS